MNDEAMELLFRTIRQILNNQNRIMKQLHIIEDTRFSWEDDASIKLAREVSDFAFYLTEDINKRDI